MANTKTKDMIKISQYSRTITSSIILTTLDIYSNMNFSGYITNILIIFGGLITLFFAVYEIYKSNKEESLSKRWNKFLHTTHLQYNDSLLSEGKLSHEEELQFKKDIHLMLEQFGYQDIKEFKKNNDFIINFDNESFEIHSALKSSIIPLLNIFIKTIEKSEFKFSPAKHIEHLLLDKVKEDEYNRNT